MNAKEAKDALHRRAESVAQYLLPGGKRVGHEWRSGDTAGGAGDSLGVHLSGEKAGVWCDFASGETGDLLDLWMACRGLSFAQAYSEACEYLGATPEPKFTTAKRSYSRPEKPKCHTPKAMLAYLTETRKLTLETIADYKLAENERGILFPQLRDGELINVKYLKPRKTKGEKNQWQQESDCEPCLFGWQAIKPNDRTICITEGEIDALSVYQCGTPALSLPSGAKNMEWLPVEFERLERFEEIILCLDMDEAGRGAVAAIIDRLGADRCRVAELPLKDANEMLVAGRAAELQQALKNAGYQDPEELLNAMVFRDEVFQRFNGGIALTGTKLPYTQTHGKFGIRPGELTIWTGINGHGKSQLLGDVLVDQVRQGEKICIFSGEMNPGGVLYRMVRQATGMRNPPSDMIDAAMRHLGQSVWIFNLVGTAKADRLLDVFAYARKRYGITQFVIDSLLKCGFNEDGYNEQKHFVERLCDFNKRHLCHIHLVAHQRKTADESKSGGKMGVRGAGAITDMAENVMEVWRNKEKQGWNQSVEDGILTCSKQRNGEWEGPVNLWFNLDSFQYRDSHDAPIRCSVDLHKQAINPTEYVEF